MEKGTHRPVLLREAVAALGCRPGGFWVDGTVGAGGHAEAILRASAPDGRLLGLDRDREALERARRLLAPFGDRVALRHDDFRSLPEILEASGRPPDGILLDLGISSQQIDDPARGFSFQEDGPLDMRMDRTQDTTAATLVNALPARELAAIVARYGEEPAARRIARALVAERAREPITTTGRLAAIVARVARSRRRTRTHPATRTFQALRIAVNRELDGLDRLIEQAVERLPPGGRIAVISFHSLEDRIVKRALRALARRREAPRRDVMKSRAERPRLQINARLVKERDRARARELRLLLLCGAAIVIPLLGYVRQRVEFIRLSYKVERLSKERQDLQEINKQLTVERSLLLSPDRIDKVARRQLGLGDPVPEDVRRVRVIDGHIRNLRRKIETQPSRPYYILAVPGIGYRFTNARPA